MNDGDKVYSKDEEMYNYDSDEEAAIDLAEDLFEEFGNVDRVVIEEGVMRKPDVSHYLKDLDYWLLDHVRDAVWQHQHEDWEPTDLKFKDGFAEKLLKLIDEETTVVGGLWDITDIKTIPMIRCNGRWVREEAA